MEKMCPNLTRFLYGSESTDMILTRNLENVPYSIFPRPGYGKRINSMITEEEKFHLYFRLEWGLRSPLRIRLGLR